MAPDAETIIAAYLNTNLDERVVGTTPQNIHDPWVRLTLIDDPSIHGGIVDKAIEALVQIDCFAGKGGTQADAKDLSLEVRSLLHATNENPVSAGGGWIYGARVSFARQPDQSFERAMERYVATATVWMHS